MHDVWPGVEVFISARSHTECAATPDAEPVTLDAGSSPSEHGLRFVKDGDCWRCVEYPGLVMLPGDRYTVDTPDGGSLDGPDPSGDTVDDTTVILGLL